MTVVALLRNTLRIGDKASVQGAGGLLCGLMMAVFSAAFVWLMMTPTSASAAQVRLPLPFSPITGSGSGLTIETPGGIAVDETSGNVFLNDGTTKTDILGAEGGAPAGLVSPFEITGLAFNEPVANGVAVDNSAASPNKGTLYIYTGSAPPKIKKFVRNPATEKYEPAGELTNTTPEADSNGGVAVDGAGNLFVSDFASSSVVKFNPAGTLEKTYNLFEPVRRPGPLAIDAAGDLFVARTGVGSLFKYPADAFGEISASNFVEILPGGATGIAVDPVRNALFVALGDHVVEYDATTLAVKSEFGQGTLGESTRIAVNSATNRVYVADNGAGKKNVAVFGPPVPLPTVTATPATGITGTKATLTGKVNPEGIEVTDCFFEYGTTSFNQTAPCEGAIPTDSSDHLVSANVSGLSPDGVTYRFRLVATNANGTDKSGEKTFVTAATVVTEAATEAATTSATLHGTVRPEGLPYTDCKFEYGLTTSSGFEDVALCNPAAGSIEADFAPHAVSAALSGLQPNGTYRYRLTATNANGTVSGEVLTFNLSGPPEIAEVRAINADQDSATLEAKVNPRGFQTNYFFEWGPTAAYGQRIPASLFEPSLGAGNQPVLATAPVSGLAPGTIYHYRVVARNSAGTTASPDQLLETLNACGLPDGRCLELVSPRDSGPVAATGISLAAGADLEYQAARGAGGIAYDVEHGLPGATRGADVLYAAQRAPGGWQSLQLSAPILVQNHLAGANSNSSTMLFLNHSLSCGFMVSNQPLTGDPGMNFVREAGGSNLYRRNANGSYTAITTLPPQNALDEEVPKVFAYGGIFRNEYQIVGASQDCRKIVFTTPYRYPGLLSAGEFHLYEWEEGTFRNLAPEGTGQPAPAATGGTSENHSNVVSEDGARTFFSANRISAPNPGEVGKTGIFVREASGTRDISNSETAVANLDATYQYATPDGSRVFFTANAGLTTDTSSTGTDLYEYNLGTNDLTDLSAEPEPGGAQVGGFVGASADGSRVYFAARGQLVPGRGNSLSENVSSGTYSLYGAAGGVLTFVGTIRADELTKFAVGGVTVTQQEFWTSRVSPSGRYLLFETSANFAGYYSGSPLVREAYLYDAVLNSTVCVSCRQDGQPSVASAEGTFFRPLTYAGANVLHSPQTLVEVGGQAKVFFASRDRLAPGAVDGLTTVYEWSHGQVFRIATEPPGLNSPAGANSEAHVRFDGASADGSDLYFGTPDPLTWEDGDGRPSLYDARTGGGFPAPPPPPAPCNPAVEGSCQSPASQPPSTPSPATATFNGPGNEKPKKQGKKKNSGKKKNGNKKKSGNKKSGKSKRHANGNRRAGK